MTSSRIAVYGTINTDKLCYHNPRYQQRDKKVLNEIIHGQQARKLQACQSLSSHHPKTEDEKKRREEKTEGKKEYKTQESYQRGNEPTYTTPTQTVLTMCRILIKHLT